MKIIAAKQTEGPKPAILIFRRPRPKSQTQSNKCTQQAPEREGCIHIYRKRARDRQTFPVSNKPTALGQPGFPPESLMSY